MVDKLTENEKQIVNSLNRISEYANAADQVSEELRFEMTKCLKRAFHRGMRYKAREVLALLSEFKVTDTAASISTPDEYHVKLIELVAKFSNALRNIL